MNDRIGLRMAVIMSGDFDMFKTLVSGFFTECSTAKLEINFENFVDSSKLQTSDIDDVAKFSRAIKEFFLTYTELIVNEVDVPTYLNKVIFSTRAEFKDSNLDHGSRYYELPLHYYMQVVSFAHCPTTIDNLNEAFTKITKDEDLREAFFDECLEVDTKTKIVTLKSTIIESLKNSQIDRNLFWYYKDIGKKISEELKVKMAKGSEDGLTVSRVFTNVARLLYDSLATSCFWDKLLDLTSLLDKLDKWDVYLESFLRCAFMHLESATNTGNPANLEIVFHRIEECMEIMAEKLDEDERLQHFAQRVDEKRAFTKTPIRKDSKARKISCIMEENSNSPYQTAESLRQAAVRTKFETKKTRLFNKIRKRKYRFMNNLEDETKAITEELARQQSGSGLTCCLTQNPLSDSKTYFMIAQLYHINVILDKSDCHLCRVYDIAGNRSMHDRSW